MNVSPGRVDLTDAAGSGIAAGDVAHVRGFEYATAPPSAAATGGIRGNMEANPLNQAYFSAPNFQIIQNAIRKMVYDKTGDVIDPVGTDDLFMVMRAIYLQYGRNLPTQIREQIAELNERVVTWCVPKIVAEINMYKTYKKDISTMPVPMAHPVNQSGAGTRSLPFKQFF
jgi:hypothetical protein